MNLVRERTVTVQDESIGDLLRDLRDEAMVLIRQQIELAKAETSEKVSTIGKNTAYMFAGGMVLFAGSLFLLAAATVGLGYGLIAAGLSAATAQWLSPLIIGVVVAVIGYILVQKAISTFKRTSVVPEKTVHSIKEDRQWLTRRER